MAQPGIYGIALNGKNDTPNIVDTDAGQYDNDTIFDRAVGPMQFIPSTWSVVGVDADGDGERNPQDIDDAALATAVYLCSGDDDLSTDAGPARRVYRYNHSNDYVDLVLSIMEAYLDGDFTSVPNGTTSAGVFLPDPAGPSNAPARTRGKDRGKAVAGAPRARRPRRPSRRRLPRPPRRPPPTADADAHADPEADAHRSRSRCPRCRSRPRCRRCRRCRPRRCRRSTRR